MDAFKSSKGNFFVEKRKEISELDLFFGVGPLSLNDKIQNKILYAPLHQIPPNREAVKQGKSPKSSEEPKPTGKKITLRDQIQKKILDEPLYLIPPNGKVV